MNDVLASVCRVRALRASSRYDGTLSILSRTASSGDISGREGSNKACSWHSGDEGRDDAGVNGTAGCVLEESVSQHRVSMISIVLTQLPRRGMTPEDGNACRAMCH